MLVLALTFGITALAYAMVGFGGGSTYNALLVLGDTPYQLVPSIALICNIVVVSGGTWRYARTGHMQWRKITPFFIASVPAAFIGGRIEVSELVFVGLLGAALLLAGLEILLNAKPVEGLASSQDGAAIADNLKPRGLLDGGNIIASRGLSGVAGGVIGLLSGIVGIGGGIFLAPVLYGLRSNGLPWGRPKQIAAASSVFILANSIAGLSGQLLKLGTPEGKNAVSAIGFSALLEFWPLFLAVLVGGQAGSIMGSKRLNPLIIRRMTGLLIVYVALRLIWRWLALMGWV